MGSYRQPSIPRLSGSHSSRRVVAIGYREAHAITDLLFGLKNCGAVIWSYVVIVHASIHISSPNSVDRPTLLHGGATIRYTSYAPCDCRTANRATSTPTESPAEPGGSGEEDAYGKSPAVSLEVSQSWHSNSPSFNHGLNGACYYTIQHILAKFSQLLSNF